MNKIPNLMCFQEHVIVTISLFVPYNPYKCSNNQDAHIYDAL